MRQHSSSLPGAAAVLAGLVVAGSAAGANLAENVGGAADRQRIDYIPRLVERRPAVLSVRPRRLIRPQLDIAPALGVMPVFRLTPPIAPPAETRWVWGSHRPATGQAGLGLVPPRWSAVPVDRTSIDVVIDTAARTGRLVLTGQTGTQSAAPFQVWLAPRLALVTPSVLTLTSGGRWRDRQGVTVGSAWAGGRLTTDLRRDSAEGIWLYRLQARQTLLNRWLTLKADYDQIGPANARLSLSTALRLQW